MEYKIIFLKVEAGFLAPNLEAAAEKFATEVNQHIASGWEPQGGVAPGANLLGRYLFQAMIKRR